MSTSKFGNKYLISFLFSHTQAFEFCAKLYCHMGLQEKVHFFRNGKSYIKQLSCVSYL